MSHRPVVVALLALSLLLIAGSPATTVATDACGDPTTERDAGVTPWTDLCSLEVIASTTGSGPDTVTTLEVRVGVVATDRLAPSALEVGWETDGCVNRLAFGDASMDAAAYSTVGRDCGDGEGLSDCFARVTGPPSVGIACRGGYERLDVAPPVVEHDAYVWRLQLEGPLAELLGDHRPGTEMQAFEAAMGGRANGTAPIGLMTLCFNGGDPATCYSTSQDLMVGTRGVTIS